jgi:hypothetical protein
MSKGPAENQNRKIPLAVALLHYPTVDRLGNIVATNVTNFDIHDISRSCRVYGVDQYFIVHPIKEQLMFVERVLDHWRTGEGSKFNPMRKTALTTTTTAESVEQALALWGRPKARVVSTHARTLPGQKSLKLSEFRSILMNDPNSELILKEQTPLEDREPESYLLVFGTGFGLTMEFMRGCWGVLEPIKGDSADDYRHLSVRSAASICLDRLLGAW